MKVALQEGKVLSHYNPVRKFNLMHQAMNILDAWVASEKLEKLPAWPTTKVKNEREVVEEAQKEQRTVILQRRWTSVLTCMQS